MSVNTPANHRIVVVTGATAGLGRAIAARFAAGGDKVGLIGRDETALRSVQAEIAATGGEAAYAVADVSEAAAVMDAAAQFERELGPIDIWINNAMVTVFSPVEAIDPAEFRRVTDVTYLGQVHGTIAALARMRERRRGQIILIGSALAFRGIPLQSAYCGAKHAIHGFTDALRSELLHAGSAITLSIVEMPAMNTPQFDWARVHITKQPKPAGGAVYQPEACAEAVWRASHTKVREYWVGTSTFLTIVGNILLPAFMDRYLARHAIAGQMRADDVAPGRADNLYEPVGPLHRARGSFSAISKSRAMILPGQTMRICTVAMGAAVFFVLGGVAGALLF